MKAFLQITAAAVLWTGTAVGPASAADSAQPASADMLCLPGMTAPTPGVCSRPGFHWAYTTASMGHNNYDRSVWMLLPDK
jgi:hypothetical protein